MKRRLDELANITMGQSPSSEFYNANRVGMPFLQGCTTFGRIYPKYDTWTTSFNKEANPGDVLFTVRAPVGDVNICKIHTAIGRGLAAISAKTVLSKYLFYLLQANKSLFMSSSSGTIYQSINKDKLGLVELAVHSDEEQRHIVGTIGSVDDLIEKNEGIVEKIEKMVKAAFLIVEKSNCGRLESFGNLLSRCTTGLNPRQNFVLGRGRNFYVTIKNMYGQNVILDKKCDRIDDNALSKISSRSHLSKGDVLFSGIGTIGRTFLCYETPVNWNISESVFCFSPNATISSEFLYELASSSDFVSFSNQNASGAAQKGIRMSDLKSHKVFVPNDRAIKDFTRFAQPLLLEAHILRSENEKLEALKTLLLDRYFGSH